MMFLKWAGIVLIAITCLAVLIFAIMSRKPIRYVLLSSILGIAALALVELTKRFTGVHIPVNEWTAGTSAVLGVPGVCALLALKLILGV